MKSFWLVPYLLTVGLRGDLLWNVVDLWEKRTVGLGGGRGCTLPTSMKIRYDWQNENSSRGFRSLESPWR